MWALLIPLGVGWLICYPMTRTQARSGSTVARQCTPFHEEVFLRAMQSHRPSAILRVAQCFEDQGFDPSYARRLRLRASLPSRSLAWRMAAERVFRKALASDNAEAVKAVAEAFAGHGLTNAAKMLFELSRGLEMASELESVEMQLEESEEETEEETELEPEPEVKTRIAEEGSAGA